MESNKRDIVERGWYSYNQILMTYPIVCVSMMKSEKKDERKEKCPIKILYHKINEMYDLIESPSPILDTIYLKPIDGEKWLLLSGLVSYHSVLIKP